MTDDNKVRQMRRSAYKMAIETVALCHPDELGEVYASIQKTLGITDTKETADVVNN